MLPSVEPGYLVKTLPQDAPEQPESWKDLLKDFNETILPGVGTVYLNYYRPGHSLLQNASYLSTVCKAVKRKYSVNFLSVV